MYAARLATSSGLPRRPVGILSIMAFSNLPVGSNRLKAPWTQHRRADEEMCGRKRTRRNGGDTNLGSDWSRLDDVEPVAIAPPLCSQRPDKHKESFEFILSCGWIRTQRWWNPQDWLVERLHSSLGRCTRNNETRPGLGVNGSDGEKGGAC